MTTPNHALQRTRRERSRLQAVQPVRRVAELGLLGGRCRAFCIIAKKSDGEPLY